MAEIVGTLLWVQVGSATWLAFILLLVYLRFYREPFLRFWSLSFAVLGLSLVWQLVAQPPYSEEVLSWPPYLLGMGQFPLIVLAAINLKPARPQPAPADALVGRHGRRHAGPVSGDVQGAHRSPETGANPAVRETSGRRGRRRLVLHRILAEALSRPHRRRPGDGFVHRALCPSPRGAGDLRPGASGIPGRVFHGRRRHGRDPAVRRRRQHDPAGFGGHDRHHEESAG